MPAAVAVGFRPPSERPDLVGCPMTRASLCCLLLSAIVVTAADPAKPPPDTIPKLEVPPAVTPPMPVPPAELVPVVAKVELVEPKEKGEVALAKALAEATAAYAKVRDYSGYMVRQERIGGKLLPEQTAEIRVRTEPFCIYTLTLAPKALFNQELAYMSDKKDDKVRVKSAGVAGVSGFVSVEPDHAKANVDSKYTVTNTGIGAILSRVEGAMEAERLAKNPAQVLVDEYTFQGRPCTRYDIFCDRPHTKRFAARMVLYVDAESKLPVRFEAYDAPKPGEKDGELTECVSFVKLVFNAGLGDGVFEK